MDRERVLEICARAYILKSQEINRKPELCKEFVREGEFCPTKCQIYRAGGLSGIKERIKRGGLNLDDELGVWNSGFISGLRNSGSFVIHCCYGYLIWTKRHEELLMDLKESKHCEFGHLSKNATLRLQKFPLFEYPSESGYGKEYIAGLLAGGTIRKVKNEQWIMLGNRGGIKKANPLYSPIERNKVLREWGIAYKEWGKGVVRGILISPFYGALFSQYMPLHSACKMLSIKEPALCPEIGIIYWNMLKEKGTRKDCDRKAPWWSDVLPYVGSYVTNYKNAIMKKDIRREGVEMGILGISDGLREVIKEWIGWHKKNHLGDNSDDDLNKAISVTECGIISS